MITNTTESLALVFARNAFYRRLHFLTLAALLLSFVIISILLWVLFFLLRNPTPPLFFATDEVSRLIDIVPLNKPNMSNDDVSAWAVDAVQAAFSYDFVNFRSQLQSAQKYFTNYGWSNYMKAVTATNNLVSLEADKMIFTAQVVDKPKLVAQGILAGSYAWKFDMPVLMGYWYPPYDKISYYNAITVTVLIQRQPILQSYKGLGIVQVIGTAANTAPQQGPGAPPQAPSS